VAQFGIHGNPNVQSLWRSSSLPDDPIKVSNTRGTVVFATAGPNTRTTQIFVNTREQGNTFLDKQGFSPFGQVIEGMDIVEQFYAGYGDGPPGGKGPNQALIQARGNDYLKQQYPKLSYISNISFVEA
jgi:peptidyl-prolyl cis-trans isomerase A (cyclophilin A)